VSVGDRQLTVTLPAQAAARGDKLISVNVAAFDKAFAKDAGFYLDAKGSNRIGQRYDRVKEFIKTSHTIEASQVTVDKEGHVRFSDGRHRYAALRDSGATKIPLAMDRESQRNAKQFGLTIRALAALLLLTAHRNVRMRQAGDVPGHEFHGNQWTGGHEDPTNTSHSKELLRMISSQVKSGSAPNRRGYFTVKEIAEVLGVHSNSVKGLLSSIAPKGIRLKYEPGIHSPGFSGRNPFGKTGRATTTSIEASVVWEYIPKSERMLAAIPVPSRDLTPLHKAADAHYAPIMLAVSAAFMRGRKVLKASLRGAEFNPDQPRDEKGQWTSGGVQPEEKAIAERLGLPTTYSGTDSMTSLSGRLNPESARAYFAGKAVDNPIPKNKTLTMEQAQRLPIMMSGETKEVSIAPLKSTQDYVQPSAVEKYKNGEGMTSRPVVATIHGEEVLLNGNHNVLAAQLRGQDTIKVQHLGDFSKHADYIKKVDAQGGGFTSLSAAPNISAAVSAIRASLVHDLPPALEKAYIAGGSAGAGGWTVGGLKAAGDVEGHAFHGNQYTTVYHGTTQENAAKIEKEGLHPDKSGVVFATESYDAAAEFAKNLNYPDPTPAAVVTLRVPKQGLIIEKPLTKGRKDPVGTRTVRIVGHVPAEHVQAVRHLGDKEGHEFHGNQWTVAGGGVLYHGTSSKLLPSIKEKGIIAGHTKRKGEVGSQNVGKIESRDTSVYLSTTERKARDYADVSAYAHGGHPVVIAVHIPKEHASSVVRDEQDKRNDSLRISRDIPASWIVSHRTLATKLKTSFDAKNSNAATWALTHATQIADDISQTSKDNIALAVARAQEEGDLNEQYDEILDAVGDEARASLIARTESMTAVNEGQRDAWDQALEKGLLTEDNRVVWIATSDACPECEELDGEERTLDGEYPGDGGDGPPLHPNCRCTEGIVG
jgi:RNA:NAD 2'-phosphotransferase (TPT1/KptA family)